MKRYCTTEPKKMEKGEWKIERDQDAVPDLPLYLLRFMFYNRAYSNNRGGLFMSFKRTTFNEELYLEMVLEGNYSFERFLESGQIAAREAKALNKQKILIDASRLQGLIPELDKVQLGVHSRSDFDALKVAFIDTPEQNMRFAENVSVNRGANVRSFRNRAQALEWLLQ